MIVYCPVCTTNDEVAEEDLVNPIECNNCETVYSVGEVELDDTVIPVDFTGAIIFCPKCCTNVDAKRYGVSRYECEDCETVFVVELIPAVLAAHSMFG